jgi:hypothetical protein
MKIKLSELKQIIKEETSRVLNEQERKFDDIFEINRISDIEATKLTERDIPLVDMDNHDNKVVIWLPTDEIFLLKYK